MDDFTDAEIHTGETTVFLRWGGTGPPLLLLHGFPQTHLMWAGVAPLLAGAFTVICPDLRGYGRSGCPASDAEHAAYSKRAMARDLVGAMDRLGHGRFMVAGHDRGGRVAYRLALDHPERVDRLAVLDMTMQGLPSRELAERLLAANPDLEIIFASGYPVNLSDFERTAPGRTTFLHKPFAPEALAGRGFRFETRLPRGLDASRHALLLAPEGTPLLLTEAP